MEKFSSQDLNEKISRQNLGEEFSRANLNPDEEFSRQNLSSEDPLKLSTVPARLLMILTMMVLLHAMISHL